MTASRSFSGFMTNAAHCVTDMLGFKACAFCLERSGFTVVACACKGGTQHVHAHCLRRWIQTGALSCAACRRPYCSIRDLQYNQMIRACYYTLFCTVGGLFIKVWKSYTYD